MQAKKVCLVAVLGFSDHANFSPDLSQKDSIEIVTAIFSKYPHYNDSTSRNAAQKAIIAHINGSHGSAVLKELAKIVTSTATPNHTFAISDLFTVLEWTNSFIVNKSATFESDKDAVKALILSQANFLYSVVTFSGIEKRQRQNQSALRTTRTSIAHALSPKNPKSQELTDFYIATLLAKPKVLTEYIPQLISIAALAGASIDLLSANPSVQAKVEAQKEEIFKIYTQNVLGTKVPLSRHLVDSFSPFFIDFTTQSDFDKVLAPAISKAILRASENTLSTISIALFTKLPPLIDTADALNASLLAPLLSAFGSSKPQVRSYSCDNLKALLQLAQPTEKLEKAITSIVTPLKTNKVTVPEQRVFYGLALSSVVPNISGSKIIYSGLVSILGKDVNEASLTALTEAFFKHLFYDLQSNAVLENPVSDVITKGVSEKKANLKRVWICNLVEQVLSLSSCSLELEKFISSISKPLTAAWKEIDSNTTLSVQNKVVTIGLAAVSLIAKLHSIDEKIVKPFDEADIVNLSLKNEKASFITSYRVFTKLTEESEVSWAIRALAASTKYVVALNDDTISREWALAWIYHLVVPGSPTNAQLVPSIVKDLYSEHQAFVGKLIINTIYAVLSRPAGHKPIDGDSLSHIPDTSFSHVLTTLFLSKDDIDASILKEDLVSLFVIAHHPKSSVKGGWVSLCMESSLDPGKIVEEYGEQILANISSVADDAAKNNDDTMLGAAASAAATLSFINSSTITPKLVDIIVAGLDVSQFPEFDDDSLKIWNTPEGELANDPFETKKVYAENKNSKDYETKKWEESLRKEIAAKKGSSKPKYTKDQQVKVTEQLKKESQIRKSLKAIHARVHRSLALVSKLSFLSTTAYNGVEIWFPPTYKSLLDLLRTGPILSIFDGEPSRVFIGLSINISDRVGSRRDITGVGILRALGVYDVDSPLLLEPGTLKDFATNLLYTIQLKSEKRPLDTISLIYLLPLILKTLEGKGGVGTSVEEEIEEQAILALEILTTHADEFKQEIAPRKHLLSTLLSLLSTHPSKTKSIKDCLICIVQSIGETFADDELSLLIKASTSPDIALRTIVLEILDNELDLSDIDYSNEIWIERFDAAENIAETADSIWTDNEFAIDETSAFKLIPYLDSKAGFLRLATSRAIAAATEPYPEIISKLFDELVELFKEKTKPPTPIKDKYGMVINPGEKSDTWEVRSGISLTFKEITPLLSNDLIEKFFVFLIDDEALGDTNANVRAEIQSAGRTIIQFHGVKIVETLIPVFEGYLSKTVKKSEVHDRIRESVVIIYGALACHLKPSDPRVTEIIDRLISTLDTPNEFVQYAVSDCLAPLVKLFESRLADYFRTLEEKLFTDPKYAGRRGAAYGISGLVKGAGISAMSDYDLTRILVDAVEDRRDPKKRQGAQFVFECLSQSLGTYFEPYALEIIPLILSSLGDASPEVREATSYSARQIMKHATGYGIKKLIPLALDTLDSTAWRAKKGAVELLGIMAYLDPRQLSTSLSTIIPELVGVLNDSHREVRTSANQSLQRFGEVIKNPEIQSLVPTLIQAISDPTQHTEQALDGLLKTQFVHYIDAPSLALVIHILHRGLKDRSANIKRKAAQIVGNMSILTDGKDLIPYLPSLVAELEVSMVDPVPATRSTASRAIGALVEKLGEDQFPDLIGRLMATLKSKDKIGDRLGSAQGLAEITYGLGIRKLEELMPIILKNTTSPQAHIREGFMPLMIYIPASFGASFSPYLTQIIPPILAGLADDVEGVRETSLKAGRLLVKNYATRAVDLLLPELERGLSDYSYRIRTSSVELTGDLLFQLTGVSGKTELSEEDRIIYGDVSKSIVEVLGIERRDRIFSAIFMCRSDTWPQVRGAAVEVWKSLVFNTPRMVKEILPTLTQMIIRRLASTNEDQRTIAAQSLGELVRRVGGTSLSRLLPTLSEGMSTSDADARQGICIAVTELIGSTQVDDLEAQQALFINIIRIGLGDSDEKVRTAAAKAFDSLQDAIGNQIMDKIIPDLITMLQSEDSADNALAALRKIIATKGAIVFPIIMPTLLTPPMTVSNARSLGALAAVAGYALIKRLESIINAVVDALISEKDEEAISVFSESLDSIILSIDFDDGAHTLMQHMLSLGRHIEPERRKVAFSHMATFFTESSLDYSLYTEDWVQLCIYSLDDADAEVVKAAWSCLSSLVKAQSKDVLEELVKPARQALHNTGVAGQELPGFTLPKGPSCVLPIFLQGLMYGSNDTRETSALGIADVVERTSAANLKPFVTQVTGPLIRIVGERFPSSIKAAILYTLNTLLVKIPAFLKPFLPQLQRTFAKALADPHNETLRVRAGKALSTLIKLQSRVDPLITELVSGARNTEDEAVIASMLQALSEIVVTAGKLLNAASKTLILEFVDEQLEDGANSSKKKTLATLVGGVANAMDTEEITKLVTTRVLQNTTNPNFAVLALNALLKVSAAKIDEAGLSRDVSKYLISSINSSDDEVSENAIRATGKYLLDSYAPVADNGAAKEPAATSAKKLDFDYSPEIMSQIVQELATAMSKSVSRSVETRRLALVVVRTVTRHKYSLIGQNEYLDVLVPAVFGCVRDSVIPVKLAAEKAYIQLLRLTDDQLEKPQATPTFDSWYKHAVDSNVLTGAIPRSVSEFTKRVGMKLAAAEIDRIQDGGDYSAVYSDRIEDELDVWAIGSVTLDAEEDV